MNKSKVPTSVPQLRSKRNKGNQTCIANLITALYVGKAAYHDDLDYDLYQKIVKIACTK